MEMSSSAQLSKTSRWGSLLQQAVAGVESRLDTILADGDDVQARPSRSPERKPQQGSRRDTPSTVSQNLRADNGLTRTRSNSRQNDRLQERLARALAGKDDTSSRSQSQTASAGIPSRTASPAGTRQDSQTNLERSVMKAGPLRDTVGFGDADSQAGEGQKEGVQDRPSVENDAAGDAAATSQLVPVPAQPSGMASRSSFDSNSSSLSSRSQTNGNRAGTAAYEEIVSAQVQEPTLKTADYEAELAQLRSDYETTETQRQEEVHLYSERIDALEAKLTYLTTDVMEAAARKAASAPSGSLERKLAQHEEKLSSLMQEGEKLSSMELKYMSTIKKLRTKARQDEKSLSEARQRIEKAEKAATEATQRGKRAEAAERRANERLRMYAKLEKEVETLKGASDSKDSVIANLRAQLAAAKDRVTEDEKIAQSAALEAERKLVDELRNGLSDIRIEKELVEQRVRNEINELKDQLEREKERARNAEMEQRREQSVSEGKMEVLRARAEEVAMGTTGDSQAKLIRQLETLQTQYALSSENWQRIEESLTNRVSGLEKERDEVLQKENDARQKARKSHLQFRKAEEDLERSVSNVQTAEHDMAEMKLQLADMTRKVDRLEDTLKNAHLDFDRERQTWAADLARRGVEQENTRGPAIEGYRLTHLQIDSPARAGSPVEAAAAATVAQHHQQSLRSDGILGVQGLPPRRQRMSTPTDTGSPGVSLLSPSDQRPSFPPRKSDASAGPFSPSRQDSIPGDFTPPQLLPRDLTTLSSTGPLRTPTTPLVHEQADFFLPNDSPRSSPQPTINDRISVVTTTPGGGGVGGGGASGIGAGPSVQLVERMSATVRRLTSEKAATRDELARLSTQRDEARGQIVDLMREVEAKRAADERVGLFEHDLADLNKRYQTTLEMLGEKSELVDELRADIQDMKGMWRDMLDRNMK